MKKKVHYFKPLTAAQIRKGVGATKEHLKLVRKVMKELGLLK